MNDEHEQRVGFSRGLWAVGRGILSAIGEVAAPNYFNFDLGALPDDVEVLRESDAVHMTMRINER